MGLVLGLINGMVLIALSALHFFWATGGTWGFDNALPTNKAGNRILNPNRFDCTFVGLGLLAFAFLFFIRIGLMELELPFWLVYHSIWVIAAIFILRSIGDFRYVGFFKKLHDNNFADLDTKYYSPLCLAIGIISILVQLCLP